MAYYLDMRYWPLWYTPVLWLIAAWLLFDIVAKWGLLSIRYVVSVKILLALTIVGLVILNKGWHHLAMAGLSAGWDWICRADYSLLSDYRESGTLGWRFFLVPLLGIGIILVLLQLRRRKPQKDNVKNEE